MSKFFDLDKQSIFKTKAVSSSELFFLGLEKALPNTHVRKVRIKKERKEYLRFVIVEIQNTLFYKMNDKEEKEKHT